MTMFEGHSDLSHGYHAATSGPAHYDDGLGDHSHHDTDQHQLAAHYCPPQGHLPLTKLTHPKPYHAIPLAIFGSWPQSPTPPRPSNQPAHHTGSSTHAIMLQQHFPVQSSQPGRPTVHLTSSSIYLCHGGRLSLALRSIVLLTISTHSFTATRNMPKSNRNPARWQFAHLIATPRVSP